MGEESIVTVIDRLVDFVKMRKRTGVNEAARALGMTPGHVEKLARLLEESGLIEVHYTLSGTELTAAQAIRTEVVKKAAEKKQSAAETSKGLQLCITESENVFEFIEEDLLKKMAAADVLLDKLEKEDLSEAGVRSVRAELASVIASLETFEKVLARLAKREGVFKGRIGEFRTRIERIEGGGKKMFSFSLRGALAPLKALASAARSLGSLPAKALALSPLKKLGRMEKNVGRKEDRLKSVLERLRESKGR